MLSSLAQPFPRRPKWTEGLLAEEKRTVGRQEPSALLGGPGGDLTLFTAAHVEKLKAQLCRLGLSFKIPG